MTPEQLQVWLMEHGVSNELRRIAREIVTLEFSQLSTNRKTPEFDWSRLLLAGSIMARSPSREVEEAALRIATGAVLLSEDANVRDTGAVLLEQLSNGRAALLAQRRMLVEPNLKARLGLTSKMEAIRRQVKHQVLEQYNGRWLSVNEFQEQFWKQASIENAWLSVSAPTASGKTFLVRHWLVDTMLSTDAAVGVYVAPTRALVGEIEDCLNEHVSELEVANSLRILSLPLSEPYEDGIEGNRKVVYVVTQERLHLLANAVGPKLKVDLLVVDEAHKIGDGGRGVILQDAIERVSRANPKAKVVFISPSTQNPEVLLQDAPKNQLRRSLDSDVPTVLQNVILASQVKGRPLDWRLLLRYGKDAEELGTIVLQSRPVSVSKKIAYISAAVGDRGGTLVYANGAAEAEKVALLISQVAGTDCAGDEEISALADLARRGVHPRYDLARVVERGVAFHYGNMPSLMRAQIEKLFRSGKIRFLVCTSTLVEGVNLSCRTIVVRGPKKGRGKSMNAPDFWNLAGRAGRWGDEFQGNILCVDYHQESVWPDGVPNRSRFPIKRETDAVMARGEDLIRFMSGRFDMGGALLRASAELEQVSAYLLSTVARDGSIVNAPFAVRHSSELISRLNDQLLLVWGKVDLPAEILAKHPGVSAVGMQKLLNYFRSVENPENLSLVPPESEDAYDRFCDVMRTINQYVYPAFFPEGLIPLHSLIVVEWLRGYPLNVMIRRRIEYHKKHGHDDKLSAIIRGTMELVEQTARYLAPKYFSAYADVLGFHFHQIGLLPSDVKGGLDIAVALEFGVSTRTLLSLMEIGLSRMAAVGLYEAMTDDDLSKEGCLAWCRSNTELIESLELPSIIIDEISRKLGLALHR